MRMHLAVQLYDTTDSAALADLWTKIQTDIHKGRVRGSYETGSLKAKWWLLDGNSCEECGAPRPSVACPDGAQICRSCFEKGLH